MNLKLRITFLVSALILAFAVIVLLLVEVSLRYLRPDLGSSLNPDPLLGWCSSEYLRFDPAASSRSDQKRILFLGDSFLAGSGVKKLNQRFPLLLGHSHPKYEIGILASGGWSIDQELWAFRQKGKSWKPTLVILAFCANNDIASIYAHHYGLPGMLKPYYSLDESGQLRLFDDHGQAIRDDGTASLNPLAAKKQKNPAWKSSYLLRFIAAMTQTKTEFKYLPEGYPQVDPAYKLFAARRELFEEIYSGQERLSWSPQDGVNHVSAYLRENFDLNSRMWDLYENLLIVLRDEVEQAGGRLVVLLLPAIFNPEDPSTIVGGDYERSFNTPTGSFTFRSAEPRDRIAAMCSRRHVLLFDPTREFAHLVVSRNLGSAVWPDKTDRHFSALGHQILAELLEAWIATIGNTW